MACDPWDSHNWSSANGRKVEIEPGKPVLQHHCSRCGRDFIEDSSSGERHAVYVSVFSFRRLPDFLAKRWLEELCPGTSLPEDNQIRSKLIEGRPPPRGTK